MGSLDPTHDGRLFCVVASVYVILIVCVLFYTLILLLFGLYCLFPILCNIENKQYKPNNNNLYACIC